MNDTLESIFIQDLNNEEEVSEKLSQLDFKMPIKTNDIYYSSIDFMFQTPKLKISSINKSTNKIGLFIDDKLENLLENFDKKIMDLLVTKSSELFEEEISNEEIEDIYTSSYTKKLNTQLKVNLNKKLVIYNKSKNLLELGDLDINNEVICLLKCSKIIYYKNYCKAYWEVLQIKLKKTENFEKGPDFKKYLIRDDENDNYKSDNEDSDILLKELKLKN